jgi:hypothetical protein
MIVERDSTGWAHELWPNAIEQLLSATHAPPNVAGLMYFDGEID